VRKEPVEKRKPNPSANQQNMEDDRCNHMLADRLAMELRLKLPTDVHYIAHGSFSWLDEVVLLSVRTFGLQGLGHDADVGNACLLDRIHDAGKGSKGHPLIGAQIDDLVSRIFAGLLQFVRQIVHIDGLSPRYTCLVFGNGHHHALLGDLFDGARLGNGYFNARLQHRRGQHEDHQQHQHHVDQRRDVDFGQRCLGASAAPVKAI
jgi:hypothetical protein